jgi:glycosyltransferase involved in cell wall biosynthesis
MIEESNTENPAPELSVVVMSPYSHSMLRRCLDSILANEKRDGIEIIVAACCRNESVSELAEKYAGVQFVQFPAEAGIPVLAAAGIERSSGEIIALTDSSCVADSNWIASILKAHQKSALVIGGAVEVCGEMKLLDWAAYFCEYGQFAYPLKSGAVDVLPGNNISFKRPVLTAPSEYAKNEFWKTHWCRELQAKDIALISEPSIRVYWAREFQLFSFLSRRFDHGRCFAGMRAKQLTFSGRLIYVAGSIFLPLVFLFRTMASVLGKKRFLKKLALSSPFLVLAILFWCFGETCGYLAGTGKSCDYIC